MTRPHPAEQARERVEHLRAHGYTLPDIAEMTGVPVPTLSNLVNTRPERIYLTTHNAIMTVGSIVRQSRTETAVAQLRALSARGWGRDALAAECPLSAAGLDAIRAGRRDPYAWTAREIDRLYRRLMALPAPTGPAADQVRTIARRKGWAEPPTESTPAQRRAALTDRTAA